MPIRGHSDNQEAEIRRRALAAAMAGTPPPGYQPCRADPRYRYGPNGERLERGTFFDGIDQDHGACHRCGGPRPREVMVYTDSVLRLRRTFLALDIVANFVSAALGYALGWWATR